MKKVMILVLIALVSIPLGTQPQWEEVSSEDRGALETPSMGTGSRGTHQLVVLHTNDFHGHPLKFFNYPAPDVGGLPAIATLAAHTRQEQANVLLLDAGDLNTGRPESNFFKAAPDIIGYNYAGYDAVALGNHEFDNSLDILQRQMRLAKFPFLSANVTTQSGEYVGLPYLIKDFKDFRVGIFGLTTKRTEIVGNPEIVKALVFEDEVTAAQRLVDYLEERTDVIIALVHLGIYQDTDQGSKRVAAQVEGIDLIIDGHTHTRLSEPVWVNGTPIVQAWHWGLNVGKAVLTLTDGQVSAFSWEAIPINLKERLKKADGSSEYRLLGPEIPEDPYLLAILQPYSDKVETILSEVVGAAESTFFNTDVRKEETPLGDLVADSMLWYTRSLGVDFAIQNGGGIRADLPEGPIPKKTIYEILPFDNSVMVLELKGSDLQELFHYIATIAPGKGAFPQVSEGVSFTINYDNQSCEDILIQGQPIDPQKTYTLATNSYMASGGDGYQVFTRALKSYDTSMFQRDVLIEYIIEQGGQLKPILHQRIRTQGGEATAAESPGKEAA